MGAWHQLSVLPDGSALRFDGVEMATYTKTLHWNCASSLCTNLEKEYSQKPSRELKRKIDCTKTVLTSSNANTVRSTPRKPPKDRSETPVPRVKKRRVSAANVEKENQKLKSQVESLTRELMKKRL